MQRKFKNWCEKNNLNCTSLGDNVFEIGGQKFLLLEYKGIYIFNEDFELILSDFEKLKLKEVDYVLYKFGTKFYYTPVDKVDNPGGGDMYVFKYLGKSTVTRPNLPFLGIHGCYEILNGSRFYEDWIAKAKFLDINVLGICEKNTLGGIFPLQEACGEDIKPIFGETITIKTQDDKLFESKAYVINEIGWKNLLLINSEINVFNPSKYIDEEKLLEFTEGLVFVFNPATFPYDEERLKLYKSKFTKTFFQLDSVEFKTESSDKNFLLSTQKYLNNPVGVKPILICDAYYLDKEDYIVKSKLNSISGVRDMVSENQYFKSDDENLILFNELFSEEDFGPILESAIESLTEVAEICNFRIPTGKFKLPKYIMNEEEASEYETNEDLFYSLVEQGFEKRKIFDKSNSDDYINRVEKEIKVINLGGFIDYFLILHDIIGWCKKNDILTGLGRGSAAGSLVAYLLDITKVDPLEYGLLFERFLNEGRVKVSCPDIDTDFESTRRPDVKKYMEQKYGHDKVCSIGTYTTLQMRAVFRDFCKMEDVPIAKIEYLSKIMFETRDNKNARASKAPWEYIFTLSCRNKTLFDFIQEHSQMVEDTWLCHAQPRSAGIHACATLILPQGESIYSSIPVRMGEIDGEKIVVSEWEGPALEHAGYLKEDILGISQLDKFRMIVNLIEKCYGEKIDIYQIPLEQKEVFEMFGKGECGDVFHLGSKGLTAYCVQVKPTTVRELCAMLALYRPGPMEGNFHNEYVALKNGQKEITYMPGLEEITKETFGLLAYQEQIMRICVDLADFTLVEADNIRKGMGKVNRKFFAEQGEKFMKGALKNGYDEDYLKDLWNKMCSFGGYAFNKSHALCYAITGYYCQYLKWKYPLPYWITALEFATDENVLRFISEINKSGKIRVSSPDINRSQLKFFADFKKSEIIWSISKVKQCGQVSVNFIFEEREKNGEFFSLEEFLSRVDKSKVNKSVVENLILAGAFDSLEDLKFPSQRKILIEKYRELMAIKVDKEKDWFEKAKRDSKLHEDWWWLLQQKRVSGLAFFDFKTLCSQYEKWFPTERYIDVGDFQNEDLGKRDSRLVVIGGVISEVETKSSKKGDYFKIRIESNYNFVWLTIWSDLYPKYFEELHNAEGKIVLVKARSYYDSFKLENALQSDEKMEIFTLE